MVKSKILVVEDESIVATDLKIMLENIGYIVTHVTSTGEKALQKLAEIQPDLILMDIQLEGLLDGVTVTELIQKEYHIPVVYLTAYSDEHTLDRAKKTEPYGYILKPFVEREIHTTIQTALYKHQIESKLRKREQWLATILDSIGDAVIVLNTEGQVTFMNPMAEKLTGYSQREVISHDISQVLTMIDEKQRQPININRLKEEFDSDSLSLAKQAILQARSGAEVFIEYGFTPLKGLSEKIEGVVLVFRNITKRKNAELELRRNLALLHDTYKQMIMYALNLNRVLEERKQTEKSASPHQEPEHTTLP
ncbi:response regulator [candidate division CSSED10-310 bacterium]|uniref:Response regulator n=1 Tax=candidate division CSSED10-310 bacterium TaxID=2855610 RepID=A0ABV6Z6A3_UNCC1